MRLAPDEAEGLRAAAGLSGYQPRNPNRAALNNKEVPSLADRMKSDGYTSEIPLLGPNATHRATGWDPANKNVLVFEADYAVKADRRIKVAPGQDIPEGTESVLEKVTYRMAPDDFANAAMTIISNFDEARKKAAELDHILGKVAQHPGSQIPAQISSLQKELDRIVVFADNKKPHLLSDKTRSRYGALYPAKSSQTLQQRTTAPRTAAGMAPT
ncbi:MAG: hypothetical protein KGI37_08725 [Alphaproteobacteria bacterium]|nr:hypothetical protein [Alphaproteobacteria bacterium]